MVQPQRKTKFNDMLEIIAEIMPPFEMNIFQLNRVKNEAEKMKKDRPAEAFTLLGLVSCLEKDIESLHQNHKNAFEYDDSPQIRFLYIISLFNCGLYHEAYNIAFELHNKGDKADTKILDIIIKCAFQLDMHKEFDTYTEIWKDLTGKEHFYTDFLEDNDAKLYQFLSLMDKSIEKHPEEMLDEFDPDMMALADELVAGIEV